MFTVMIKLRWWWWGGGGHGGDDVDKEEQVREEDDDDDSDGNGDGDVSFILNDNARWRMMVMTMMYVWLHPPFSIDVVFLHEYKFECYFKDTSGNWLMVFGYKMADILTKQIST